MSCTHYTAVFWNPYNGIVQCHSCGHVYVPIPEPPGEAYRDAVARAYPQALRVRDVQAAAPC